MRSRVLFVTGSLNQTTMLHQVAAQFAGADACFTPLFADGLLRRLAEAGLLDFTTLAGQARRRSLEFLHARGARVVERAAGGPWDLVVMGTDLLVPRALRGLPMVLVQEGMTDPEDWRYRLVRALRLPRFVANTSMTGLSFAYRRFCVASQGFFDLFARKGVPAERMRITGLPNFDHVDALRENDFPHRGYVLAATSCLRETLKPEDRRGFIRRALRLADGRELIFKLHPNEDHDRARREVLREAPRAIVFADGNTDHMVANCDVLVTRYSTVVLVAAALGKEIHCDLAPEVLRALAPLQTGGDSARRIAEQCREVLAA